MVGLRRTVRNFPRVDFTKTIPPYGGFGLNAGFIAGMRPSFWLRFADTGSVVDVMGGVVPTFSRNSIATVQDWEGIIRNVDAGEIRFQGLRRVKNLMDTQDTTAWLNQGVSSIYFSDIKVSRITNIQGGAGNNFASRTIANCFPANKVYRVRAAIRGSKNGIVRFSHFPGTPNDIPSANPSQTTIKITTDWQTYASSVVVISPTASTAMSMAFLLETGGANFSNTGDWIEVKNIQLEEITGQTNQNPAEFVSNNDPSLVFPFHGCGVDGVQYFPYQNGNTVDANNVVHEDVGAAFPVGSPFAGYLSEGARTNLTINNENYSAASWGVTNGIVTPDTTTAPDGNITADTWTPAAGLNNIIRDTVAFAGNSTYTYSIFIKSAGLPKTRLGISSAVESTGVGGGATFDLATGATSAVANCTATSELLPNGWIYCTITFLTAAVPANIGIFISGADASGSTTGGDGINGIYLWRSQTELATFASSSIPTVAAAVTRNNDVLIYLLANWYNPALGTIFAHWQQDVTGTIGFPECWSINDGSTVNETMQYRADSNGQTHLKITAGGVAQCDFGTNISALGVSHKMASAWALNDAENYVDGVSGGTRTPAIIPAGMTQFAVGSNGIGVGNQNSLFGVVDEIPYYPYRFNASLLQAITI